MECAGASAIVAPPPRVYVELWMKVSIVNSVCKLSHEKRG